MQTSSYLCTYLRASEQGKHQDNLFVLVEKYKVSSIASFHVPC